MIRVFRTSSCLEFKWSQKMIMNYACVCTFQVDLKFRSRFCFSVGSIYQAPPLFVDTTLTSEESSGAIRRGTGERLDGGGRCKLVGVSVLDPIDDVFMNTFLNLPTECIAYLNATISIASAT